MFLEILIFLVIFDDNFSAKIQQINLHVQMMYSKCLYHEIDQESHGMQW